MSLITLTALLLGLQVAISDLMARRVSNRVLLAVLCVVVVAQVSAQLMPAASTPTLGQCLLGGVIGLLVLLPFHAIGWMGAGDVKLFSTIGFLLGAKALLPLWLVASLAAGAHALLVVAWPLAAGTVAVPPLRLGWQGPAWLHRWRDDLRVARQGRRGIPYAAYLGVAMIGYVLQGGSHV